MFTNYINMLKPETLRRKIVQYEALLEVLVKKYKEFYDNLYRKNLQLSRERYEYLIELFGQYSELDFDLEDIQADIQILKEDDKEVLRLRLYKQLYAILLQCVEASSKTKALINHAYNTSHNSSLQGSIIRQQPEALAEGVSGSPVMEDYLQTVKETSKSVYRGGKLRKTRRARQSKRQSRRYRR